MVVGMPGDSGALLRPGPARLWKSTGLHAHAADLVELEAAVDRGMMRAAVREAGVGAGKGAALAMLCGHDMHYLLRSGDVTVGRNVEGSPGARGQISQLLDPGH